MADVVTAKKCLPDEVHDALVTVKAAFRDVQAEDNLDVVDDAAGALLELDPEQIGRGSVLFPIVSVTAFKGAVKICQGIVDTRRKALGKTRSISVAQKALAGIDMQNISVSSVKEFKALFARAMQYAATLKNKSDNHADKLNFQTLVGCLVDKASEGFRILDEHLGNFLSSDDTDITEAPKDLTDYLDKVNKSFFGNLVFTVDDFGPEGSSFDAWQRYQKDIFAREDMVGLVVDVKIGGDEDRVQTLSALKHQASSLLVPSATLPPSP